MTSADNRPFWIRIVLAITVSGAIAAQAAERKFKVDPVHSGVTFTIRHLYVPFPGRFNSFSGYMTVDPDDPKTLRLKGEVDMSSIDTRNERRDEHLRSSDFFEVEKYATSVFESRSVDVKSDGSLSIHGRLVFRGVESDATIHAELTGFGPGHRGGQRAGMVGTLTIDRFRFGMTYNSVLENGLTVLGQQVDVRINLELIEIEEFPEGTF